MVSKLPSPQSIDVAEVNTALRHTRLGGSVHHFAEVLSTSDLALEAGIRGAKNGAWIADAQTAGRGRGGHPWHSTPGEGLYVSALFTPRLPASAVTLSLAAGLAAWEAIREVSGLLVDLRWPNDLVTRPSLGEESSKKLGGILAETTALPMDSVQARRPAMLRYAVIGIGINVGHTAFPEELAGTASSLFLEGWEEPHRQPLLIALLSRLDAYVSALESSFAEGNNDGRVLARLAEASTWLRGKRVSVPEDGGYTGTTAGLDERGFLLVDGDDGQRHTVRSGGVREL